MNSIQIRQAFLDFFESKQHLIVESAPMVVKNDPTLMFTNAGMNQFKDIFLGNAPAREKRIANTQKCLRVSGKHNDLEEVGHDTYHHTMFEMLGNWSFGDYFKQEAIEWAWELLTDVLKLDKERLYVTVFGGDKADGLEPDTEAFEFWKKWVPEERILFGSKKDNFWEMGESGPCGPCSEIHMDCRPDAERAAIPGAERVNMDDPQVIEIWNLVFIQFNRKVDGSLESLPAKHVDTGMGFERLCRVMQGKSSNYDTDIFQPYIQELARLADKTYGQIETQDIAMRVVSDHLRAIAFAIADGQLPSNNKAGYVIRRILRRAVRYGYTFLGFREPFIHQLVPVMVKQMGAFFPELPNQEVLIARVIAEEEQAFLKTLSVGIHKFEQYVEAHPGLKTVSGEFAFELFDTFGFPIDLTQLMAREKGFEVDMDGFHQALEAQKNRSRQAATVEQEDWVVIKRQEEETRFLGYDTLQAPVEIVKFRKVKSKNKEFYQIVLDQTPFYAESGGQAGDRGWLVMGSNKVEVIDTQKENNLIVHITNYLPERISEKFQALVDDRKRALTANNHSATHLMHSALIKVLGSHVQQKGSLVNDERLRFDFAHFSKLSPEEIRKIETLVNEKIRANLPLDEHRHLPMDKAREMGAIALFGEKYGDMVRVVRFGGEYSTELCGGTHVKSTGQIGMFKIVSESAIAAGIRRIEAVTAIEAEMFVNQQLDQLQEVKEILKNPRELSKAIISLQEQNAELQKQLAAFQKSKATDLAKDLFEGAEEVNGVKLIVSRVNLDAAAIKDLAFALKAKADNLFVVLGTEADGKASLTVCISDELVKARNLNAGTLVRELAKDIEGGGGGQAFFATAGGKNPAGLDKALNKARGIIA